LATALLLSEAVVQALPNSNDARTLHERALHNVTSQNKAGLGWNNPQSTQMAPFFRTGKVGWYYTWSSYANNQGNNLDFVPLLWGKNDISTWTTAVTTRLKPMFQSKAITCVLGFNE
jgi:Glycosyl hydrolase catalytic core